MLKSDKAVTRNYNPKIRAIALILIGAFCLQEISLAAPASSYSAKPTIQLSLNEIIKDPSKLQIPFEHATLKEFHKGSNGKLIIYIQDAHANYTGQMSLAKSLEHFMNQYDVNLVLAEGSSRDVTLDEIKGLTDARTWDIVAKRLLMEGIISGEEYLNLTSELPMRIMGVEYQRLYDGGLLTYKKLAEKRTDILLYLDKIRVSLQRIKNRLYPKDLLVYEEAKKTSRNNQKTDANIEELLKLAARTSLAIDTKYPEVSKLKIIQDNEKSIAFDKANEQQALLLAKLSNKGLMNEVKSLIEASKRTKNLQISQFALFNDIIRLADQNDIPLKEYSELLKYHDYLAQFSGLDMTVLLRELEFLEDDVYKHLLPDEDARKIKAIDRFLGLLDKAYNIQVSSYEFQMLLANEDDFKTLDWQAFINEKLKEFGYFEELVPYEPYLEEATRLLHEFYDFVDQRDAAFLENGNRIMSEKNQNVAFLIAGGYHTEHLTQLLKQEGTSYVVLTPVVTSETNHGKYEKLLFMQLQNINIEQDTLRERLIDTMRQSHIANGNAGARLGIIKKIFGLSLRVIASKAEKLASTNLSNDDNSQRPDKPLRYGRVHMSVDFMDFFKEHFKGRHRLPADEREEFKTVDLGAGVPNEEGEDAWFVKWTREKLSGPDFGHVKALGTNSAPEESVVPNQTDSYPTNDEFVRDYERKIDFVSANAVHGSDTLSFLIAADTILKDNGLLYWRQRSAERHILTAEGIKSVESWLLEHGYYVALVAFTDGPPDSNYITTMEDQDIVLVASKTYSEGMKRLQELSREAADQRWQIHESGLLDYSLAGNGSAGLQKINRTGFASPLDEIKSADGEVGARMSLSQAEKTDFGVAVDVLISQKRDKYLKGLLTKDFDSALAAIQIEGTPVGTEFLINQELSITQFRELSRLPFEAGLFRIRGTNQWVLRKGYDDAIANLGGEESNPVFVDVFIHNHPSQKSKERLGPSLSDIYGKFNSPPVTAWIIGSDGMLLFDTDNLKKTTEGDDNLVLKIGELESRFPIGSFNPGLIGPGSLTDKGLAEMDNMLDEFNVTRIYVEYGQLNISDIARNTRSLADDFESNNPKERFLALKLIFKLAANGEVLPYIKIFSTDKSHAIQESAIKYLKANFEKDRQRATESLSHYLDSQYLDIRLRAFMLLFQNGVTTGDILEKFRSLIEKHGLLKLLKVIDRGATPGTEFIDVITKNFVQELISEISGSEFTVDKLSSSVIIILLGNKNNDLLNSFLNQSIGSPKILIELIQKYIDLPEGISIIINFINANQDNLDDAVIFEAAYDIDKKYPNEYDDLKKLLLQKIAFDHFHNLFSNLELDRDRGLRTDFFMKFIKDISSDKRVRAMIQVHGEVLWGDKLQRTRKNYLNHPIVQGVRLPGEVDNNKEQPGEIKRTENGRLAQSGVQPSLKLIDIYDIRGPIAVVNGTTTLSGVQPDQSAAGSRMATNELLNELKSAVRQLSDRFGHLRQSFVDSERFTELVSINKHLVGFQHGSLIDGKTTLDRFEASVRYIEGLNVRRLDAIFSQLGYSLNINADFNNISPRSGSTKAAILDLLRLSEAIMIVDQIVLLHFREDLLNSRLEYDFPKRPLSELIGRYASFKRNSEDHFEQANQPSVRREFVGELSEVLAKLLYVFDKEPDSVLKLVSSITSENESQSVAENLRLLRVHYQQTNDLVAYTLVNSVLSEDEFLRLDGILDELVKAEGALLIGANYPKTESIFDIISRVARNLIIMRQSGVPIDSSAPTSVGTYNDRWGQLLIQATSVSMYNTPEIGFQFAELYRLILNNTWTDLTRPQTQPEIAKRSIIAFYVQSSPRWARWGQKAPSSVGARFATTNIGDASSSFGESMRVISRDMTNGLKPTTIIFDASSFGAENERTKSGKFFDKVKENISSSRHLKDALQLSEFKLFDDDGALEKNISQQITDLKGLIQGEPSRRIGFAMDEERMQLLLNNTEFKELIKTRAIFFVPTTYPEKDDAETSVNIAQTIPVGIVLSETGRIEDTVEQNRYIADNRAVLLHSFGDEEVIPIAPDLATFLTTDREYVGKLAQYRIRLLNLGARLSQFIRTVRTVLTSA